MNEIIRQIVADVFGLDVNTIKESWGPDDINQWDSIKHLRLITAIEQEFDITLSMDQVQSIDSIVKIQEIVAEKTKQQ